MNRVVGAPSIRLALATVLCAFSVRPASAQIGSCEPARTALVLAGGGSKGFAHIGLLQALDSLGIHPDLIVGTSIGAILGAMYAAGESGREIETHFRAARLDALIRDYAPIVSASLGALGPIIVWERAPSKWVLQTGSVRESDVSAVLTRLAVRAAKRRPAALGSSRLQRLTACPDP